MTNTQRHAVKELDILLKSATDPDNRPIIEPFIPEILALAEKFGLSGQSGGSAPFTATAIAQAIKKLLLQEPICPMTGIDEEWMGVGHLSDDSDILFQSNRCSNLFKGSNGRAWYLDAIIWKDQKGYAFNGGALLKNGDKMRSPQYVKRWPFTPKTFYIDVIRKEIAPGDFECTVKNEKQLARVFKHYDRFTE